MTRHLAAPKSRNPLPHYPNARKNTPPFPQRRESTPHHPSFPQRRESIVPPPQHPKKILRHSAETYSVIPAKAGIHNSRARGNLSSHYPNARKNTPPFPQRRKSTPIIIIRHSREGGNPQFPRTREFIVPLPQCPKKHSAIPAKTEIHPIIRHSREGGNPQFPRPLPQCPNARKNTPPRGNLSSHYPNARKNTPFDSRLCGNDVEVVLCGNEVSGQVWMVFSVEFPHARELWIPAFRGNVIPGVGNPQFPRTREFIR